MDKVVYTPGETVLVDVSQQTTWKTFATEVGVNPHALPAVIWGPHKDQEGAGGGGGSYPIRMDGYEYGPNGSNCHHASPHIISPATPSDEEVAEALASIHRAMNLKEKT